jgi:hypothetical protein
LFYDNKLNKSRCIALNGKGKNVDIKWLGKTSTLKVHMKARHEAAFSPLEKSETVKKAQNQEKILLVVNDNGSNVVEGYSNFERHAYRRRRRGIRGVQSG